MAKFTKHKKTTTVFKSSSSYGVTTPVSFRTIEDGCKAFGLSAEKRGWSIMAGARFSNAPHPDPDLKDVILWFPNAKNAHWSNTVSGKTIIETPINPSRNPTHVSKYLTNPEMRITFLKDETRWKGYKYVGVYILDKGKTLRLKNCVWKRVITYIQSNLHQIKDYLSKNSL